MPVFIVLSQLRDKDYETKVIPKYVFQQYFRLTPNIDKWASKRLSSSQIQNINLSDVSGTEWPLFGSIYYLWLTENLQRFLSSLVVAAYHNVRMNTLSEQLLSALQKPG